MPRGGCERPVPGPYNNNNKKGRREMFFSTKGYKGREFV